MEGRKDDNGKLPWHLFAPEALDRTLAILQFGATKYAERNWEKGMKWSRVFGALMRHMWAWWRGENADPETGKSHLDHAACCIHFLQAYEARQIGEDDRPNKKAIPEKEDGWKDCGRNVNADSGDPRRYYEYYVPEPLSEQDIKFLTRESMRDTYDPYREAKRALGYSEPDATGHSG